MKRHALVTGAAGFIGSHLADRLLREGWAVTAVDNFDPFYDPAVKRGNVAGICQNQDFRLWETDIRDWGSLQRLRAPYDVIVHLAAKAGVRPSIQDPRVYQDVNVLGTQNLLELARQWGVRQFVFASSSSVYGVNRKVPWREDDHVLMPVSPYACSKVSGELLGHVYSHLYGIRFIALRFFTVYGPRQRPDLAIHKFLRLMMDGEPIPVYGDGSSRRDYTFVDDIVDGICSAVAYDKNLYEIINLGNNRPLPLMELIRAIEQTTGIQARIEFQPDQPGDVPQTYADIDKARTLLGYQPRTAIRDGLKRFLEWWTAVKPAARFGLLPAGRLSSEPGIAHPLRPQ